MTTENNRKKLYNINGTVANLKVGETDKTQTPFANFTLIHDAIGKDGKQKKTLVDAYGAAAMKVIQGGFAVDGAKIRVGGLYKDEKRINAQTKKQFNLPIFHLLHCESPKTPAELQVMKEQKLARTAAETAAQANPNLVAA